MKRRIIMQFGINSSSNPYVNGLLENAISGLNGGKEAHMGKDWDQDQEIKEKLLIAIFYIEPVFVRNCQFCYLFTKFREVKCCFLTKLTTILLVFKVLIGILCETKFVRRKRYNH